MSADGSSAESALSREGNFMHDIMHEFWKCLQLQFKLSHVSLIDLIEIYMLAKGLMAFVDG